MGGCRVNKYRAFPGISFIVLVVFSVRQRDVVAPAREAAETNSHWFTKGWKAGRKV